MSKRAAIAATVALCLLVGCSDAAADTQTPNEFEQRDAALVGRGYDPQIRAKDFYGSALTPEDPAWWETPGDDDGCPDYVGSPSCPITPCVTTTIRPEGHLCVTD